MERSVCNRRVLFVILFTEQLDTATKQRAAKEAECTDQRQHVFVKLLEQSKLMSASVFYYSKLSSPSMVHDRKE